MKAEFLLLLLFVDFLVVFQILDKTVNIANEVLKVICLIAVISLFCIKYFELFESAYVFIVVTMSLFTMSEIRTLWAIFKRKEYVES